MLALAPQVVGWLLITVSLPRLAAATTSLLLMIQPVGSLLPAAVIFSERPSSTATGWRWHRARRGAIRSSVAIRTKLLIEAPV